jgi:hypothetical protein
MFPLYLAITGLVPAIAGANRATATRKPTKYRAAMESFRRRKRRHASALKLRDRTWSSRI